MLIYVPKRIHFGDDTYSMRVELAVLDWVRRLTCDYSEPKENILGNFNSWSYLLCRMRM